MASRPLNGPVQEQHLPCLRVLDHNDVSVANLFIPAYGYLYACPKNGIFFWLTNSILHFLKHKLIKIYVYLFDVDLNEVNDNFRFYHYELSEAV